jgi:hypothetical protein
LQTFFANFQTSSRIPHQIPLQTDNPLVRRAHSVFKEIISPQNAIVQGIIKTRSSFTSLCVYLSGGRSDQYPNQPATRSLGPHSAAREHAHG